MPQWAWPAEVVGGKNGLLDLRLAQRQETDQKTIRAKNTISSTTPTRATISGKTTRGKERVQPRLPLRNGRIRPADEPHKLQQRERRVRFRDFLDWPRMLLAHHQEKDRRAAILILVRNCCTLGNWWQKIFSLPNLRTTKGLHFFYWPSGKKNVRFLTLWLIVSMVNPFSHARVSNKLR